MAADRRRAPDHGEFLLLAAAALDGRIDPDSATALQAHLADCPECRAAYGGMLADHAWLADPAASVPPRPEVRARVVEAARAPRVPRVGPAPRPWSALAATAVILAVVGGGLAIAMRVPGTGASSQASSASATPVAQATPGRAVGGACTTIPAGFTSRWPFDGNPGDRVLGTEARLMGTATYGEGIVHDGLHLDGGGWVEVDDSGAAQLGAGDFTFSLWVRFDAVVANQMLVERWLDSPPSGWMLGTLENGQLGLSIGVGGNVVAVETTDADLQDGAWHHVVARRNGQSLAVFVDGVERGAAELPSGRQVDLDVAAPMIIGRRSLDDAMPLHGDLDDIVLWGDRALIDGEIAELSRGVTTPFCEAAAGAAFDGTWIAIDCAFNGARDCSRWGDRSNLELVIGAGEWPAVRFNDDAVTGCGPSGGIGPRQASGSGYFRGVYLIADFTAVSCLRASDSWANPMELYRSPGQRELWLDPDGDGYGLIFKPG